MRSVLALALLIVLCVSANAAARGYLSRSQHAVVYPGQAATGFGAIPSHSLPSGARIYRDDSVPGGLRTGHDDPPAYNDPSKFSGG